MSSILRLNRDTANIESINRSVLTTNKKLDQLISTSGSDEELLEDIKTELETSNQQLQTGNDNTSQGNQKLDNIIEEAELLKRQEVSNVTNYDFDIFSDVIVPQLPIPPTNPYIKDPFLRNSWFLKNNEIGGSTQLFWFSSDQPFAYKSSSVLTLGQIIEGGFYIVITLDKVDGLFSLPILNIYTRPTGSGDAFPGFYKSRINYGISPTQKLFSAEKIVLFSSVLILDKIKNIEPTSRRVLLNQTTIDGDALPFEEVRYLAITHDTQATSEEVVWSLGGAGWYNASDVIRHFTFTVIREDNNFVNDVETHTKLENTNNKLDQIKTAIQNINNNNDNNYNSKSLLVQSVQNNKIHYMACNRSGGGDTSGPMIVQSQRTLTHILPLLTSEKFIVLSSNDSNKLPNLGLHRVKIEGVNNNGEFQEEFIDVNGITPVETTFNYLHINSLIAISGNLTSGSVFVKREDDIKYCQIGDTGFEYSNGFFMCPSGFKAYIQSIFGTNLSSSPLFFIKYNSSTITRNLIYRFFNRTNASLIFEAGLGIELKELESFYLFNPATNNDSNVYNIKIELVPLTDL